MRTREEKVELSRELAEKMARFAAGVLLRTPGLPETKEGRHVRDQLLRAATAPGAHYAEARGAQSAPDFLHKLSLALKECREAVHWLRVSLHAEYLVDEGLLDLITDGEEIAAVLTASQTTVRKRLDR